MRRPDFLPNHGHSAAECAALIASDAADRAALNAKDMELRISTDFAALKAVDRHGGADDQLMPIYDIAYEEIGPDNGFWICATLDGEPIAVMAARLREVHDFTASLANNSFLMGAQPPDGARTIADLAGVGDWRGRIVYIGSLWIHRPHQGAFLSRLMVNAVVRMAWYRWTPRHVVAIVAQDHVKLARNVYGFRLGHGGIRIKDPRWTAPMRCEVFSFSQDEVRERILGMGAAAR